MPHLLLPQPGSKGCSVDGNSHERIASEKNTTIEHYQLKLHTICAIHLLNDLLCHF